MAHLVRTSTTSKQILFLSQEARSVWTITNKKSTCPFNSKFRFDRDLGLSGRVFCRRRNTNENDDNDTMNFIDQRLIKVRSLLAATMMCVRVRATE